MTLENAVREEAVAISSDKGVLSVIAPDGNIKMYRHPLVEGMTPNEVQHKISEGILAQDLFDYDMFPENWDIVTEEPEITGDIAQSLDSK